MKTLFWGLVIVLVGYAAYAAMMSAWQWFEIETVVEEALEPRNATDAITVKSAIVKGANKAGVPLTERDVLVMMSERAMLVNVVWTYPVLLIKGETVLAVPLSVKRTRSAAIVAR